MARRSGILLAASVIILLVLSGCRKAETGQTGNVLSSQTPPVSQTRATISDEPAVMVWFSNATNDAVHPYCQDLEHLDVGGVELLGYYTQSGLSGAMDICRYDHTYIATLHYRVTALPERLQNVFIGLTEPSLDEFAASVAAESDQQYIETWITTDHESSKDSWTH